MPESRTDAVSPGSADRVSGSGSGRRVSVRSLLGRFSILVPFVLVAVTAAIVVPKFLTVPNISNILTNASLLAIVGVGMTLVIAVRGIDLSVGSALALIASVTGIVVNAAGPFVGTLAGLATGAAVGAVNGVVITRFKVPAFVATLASMTAFRGLALLITGGISVYVRDPGFGSLATMPVLGMQFQTLVALLLVAAATFAFSRTAFGKHVVAVGGKPEAAADSGIRINNLLLMVYLLSGLSVGVAAVLQASRLGVVNGTLGTGMELQVIAVVVLGGTSMAGGRGNVIGTAIASVLLAIINSSLNLLNVPSYWQYIATGLLLVIALGLDGLKRIQLRRVQPLSAAELAS